MQVLGGVVRGEDEYAAIGRELGMFLRRWVRVQERRGEPRWPGVDRAAFMLLGQIVQDGPGRLSALAGQLCVDPSVVSRQVAALEAAGLVTRTADPADRRASLIAATGARADLFAPQRGEFVAPPRKPLARRTPPARAQ